MLELCEGGFPFCFSSPLSLTPYLLTLPMSMFVFIKGFFFWRGGWRWLRCAENSEKIGSPINHTLLSTTKKPPRKYTWNMIFDEYCQILCHLFHQLILPNVHHYKSTHHSPCLLPGFCFCPQRQEIVNENLTVNNGNRNLKKQCSQLHGLKTNLLMTSRGHHRERQRMGDPPSPQNIHSVPKWPVGHDGMHRL